MVDLITEPLGIPWSGFIDLEIGAIDSDEAKRPHITPVPVLPMDL